MKTEGKRKAVKDLKNLNHPKKGSRITVDPIRRLEDIKAIKSILSNKPRDLLLFTMGINNGLRMGDLLRLKVKQVRHLKENDSTNILEEKTGKYNILVINKCVHKAIRNYLEKVDLDDEDYLFPSRKRKNKLLLPSLNCFIQKCNKQYNLQ